MQNQPTPALLVASLMLALLPGCSPQSLLWGAGATAGTAAMQERGLRGAAYDTNLRLLINDAWFQDSLLIFERASLMISTGRIVIIGRLPEVQLAARAAALAHKASGQPVINRLTIGPDLSLSRQLTDSAITANLMTKLTFDTDVAALNYDIETRDAVVYLMGEARHDGEKRRVEFLARQISGVRAVESFIAVPPES